ncbi:MAG: hypothetical protein ACE5G2_00910 [Candidatus Krumholzibacteriia bacterium]
MSWLTRPRQPQTKPVSLEGTPQGEVSAPGRQTSRQRVFLDPAVGRAVPRPHPKYRSGLVLVLAYGLGACAPLVLRQGRRSFVWALLGMLSLSAWAGMIWRWSDLQSWLETGRLPMLPWLLGVCGATLLGVTAWSRTLLLAARDERFVPERLPGWLRHPTVAGVLGLFLPGIGLLMSAHPRRAAFAVWNVGPLVLSILLLWRAGWLWRCNQAAGAQGIPLAALEVVLLASTFVAIVGALCWIAAALDGARLTAFRAGRRDGFRSDWLALSQLGTLILILVALRPASLAQDLDNFAAGMRPEGYRVIPLCMELGAARLDPSQPEYPMRAAELYDTLGMHEAARHIRDRLQDRWEVYAEMLLRQEVRAEDSLRPQPIDPDGPLATPPPGR